MPATSSARGIGSFGGIAILLSGSLFLRVHFGHRCCFLVVDVRRSLVVLCSRDYGRCEIIQPGRGCRKCFSRRSVRRLGPGKTLSGA